MVTFGGIYCVLWPFQVLLCSYEMTDCVRVSSAAQTWKHPILNLVMTDEQLSTLEVFRTHSKLLRLTPCVSQTTLFIYMVVALLAFCLKRYLLACINRLRQRSTHTFRVGTAEGVTLSKCSLWSSGIGDETVEISGDFNLASNTVRGSTLLCIWYSCCPVCLQLNTPQTGNLRLGLRY